MSLSVEGQQCPVCHAYLFDEDDIVYCPVCGAPHHRECYNSLGHCALEELHGTDKQYTRPEANEEQKEDKREEEIKTEADHIICRSCGEEIPSDAKFCPHCRAPVGFINTEEDLGFGDDKTTDGATAKDIARFTMLNPVRYVRKFFSLSDKNRLSWNWAAFLVPVQWSFFRKNYKSGILMGIVQTAASMLMIPLNISMNQFYTEGATYNELAQLMLQNFDKIGWLPMLLAFIGTALYLGVCFFSATHADYFYRCRAIKEIKAAAPLNDEDKAEYFRKKGGVNLFSFLISHFAVMQLPSIIISLAAAIF